MSIEKFPWSIILLKWLDNLLAAARLPYQDAGAKVYLKASNYTYYFDVAFCFIYCFDVSLCDL